MYALEYFPGTSICLVTPGILFLEDHGIKSN